MSNAEWWRFGGGSDFWARRFPEAGFTHEPSPNRTHQDITCQDAYGSGGSPMRLEVQAQREGAEEHETEDERAEGYPADLEVRSLTLPTGELSEDRDNRHVQKRRGDGGGSMATLYRFAPPYSGAEWEFARRWQSARWTEYLAAAVVMRRWSRPARHVAIVVWPVLGAPLRFENSNRPVMLERLDAVEEGVARALRDLAAGRVEPNPDEYRCARCRLAAVCRKGELP